MLVQLERSSGTATLSFKQRGNLTAIDDLYQQGSAKVRLARSEPGRLSEAVLINTSGGLTEGDRITSNLDWGANSTAIVTTQAAERIYKARAGTDYTQPDNHAKIATNLTIGEDAQAFWLPQETIMFDKAAYTRKTLIDMVSSATLVAIESSIFGRTAMGEKVGQGSVREVWQIRIDGKLVFADAFHLVGDVEKSLTKPVIANGATAISTLIYVGPELEKMREIIHSSIEVSENERATGRASIVDPVLVARFFAESAHALRALTMPVLENIMKKTTNMPAAKALLPRVWSL